MHNKSRAALAMRKVHATILSPCQIEYKACANAWRRLFGEKFPKQVCAHHLRLGLAQKPAEFSA